MVEGTAGNLATTNTSCRGLIATTTPGPRAFVTRQLFCQVCLLFLEDEERKGTRCTA